MTRTLLRNALILGLLSAIGPFAIDMYLPALPAIGASLGADTRQVQLSLMVFFLALGACQLVYGPLSDMYGRKRPLYAGIVVFAFGSIGCALAPNIETLIACRLVEGIGACAGMVIPRAIVRDLHTGHEATRLMSLLMLVFSVSPILAPLAGSVVVALASWRAIFWAVTIAAVLGAAMMALWMHESRPAHHRAESSLASAIAGYRKLLADRHFLGLTFIGAFAMASFFSYLANSSFVLIEHYGVTPTQYSFFFSVNAAAFIGVAQFNARLTRRHGLPLVIRFGAIGAAIAAAVMFAAFFVGVDRLAVLAALMFVMSGFLGLVVPTSSVLALEEHGEIAGTASALLGTFQMVTGAVVIAAISPFVDGSAMPMVTGIAGCALVALVLALRTLAGAGRPELSATRLR